MLKRKNQLHEVYIQSKAVNLNYPEVSFVRTEGDGSVVYHGGEAGQG